MNNLYLNTTVQQRSSLKYFEPMILYERILRFKKKNINSLTNFLRKILNGTKTFDTITTTLLKIYYKYFLCHPNR